MDRVFPKCVQFGNVVLAITCTMRRTTPEPQMSLLSETIFGNPIVKDVRLAQDPTGTAHGFVRFQPEVIQFFDDDLYDYDGNWSGRTGYRP